MRRKNIVYYVTRQYMKQNKKRTATTFFGIAFMVLLMTCVFVGKDTGLGYLEQAASLKEGKWHVAFYDIGKEKQEEIRELPYVKETAASEYLGNTVFEQSGNAERPYLNVKGYTGNCFDWMNIELVSGRLPERGDEIVISKKALEDGADIAVGDVIEADFFRRSITGTDEEALETVFPFAGIVLKHGETKEVPEDFPYYGENTSFRENKEYTGNKGSYRITGIIETPGYEQDSAAGYTAIALLTKERAESLESCNLSVMLDLEKLPGDYGIMLREIAGNDAIDFNNYLLAFSASSSESTINTIIRFMTALFTGLIMVCSVLLIYNVFHMSFQERSRYLGMLCSVGATGRQKRDSIYFEAVYLLIFALPAGMLGGMGAILLAMQFLRPVLGEFMGLEEIVKNCPVQIRISAENILLTAAVSIVTVLLAAWLPARKIGRIGPIECIRGNTEKRQRKYVMKPSALKRWGAEGMLAGATLTRRGKKARAMVTASAAFMVILVVTAFGSSAVHKIMQEKTGGDLIFSVSEDQYDYTLYGNAYTPVYEQVVEEIQADEGVEKAVLWGDGIFAGSVPREVYGKEFWESLKDIYELNYRKELSEEEFRDKYPSETENVDVLEVDAGTLEKLAKAAGVDVEKLNDSGHPSALVVKEGAISTDNHTIWGMEPERYRYYHIENLTDYPVGEKLPLSFYNEGKDEMVDYLVEIAGFVKPERIQKYISFGQGGELWVIISHEIAEEIRAAADGSEDNSVIHPFLMIKMNGKQTDIIDRLTSLCDNEDMDMMLGKNAQAVTFARALVRIADTLLGCFVALSSVICLLNLFNSVKGWISGRGQELAILRSAGMTESQMKKMALLECLGIFAEAAALAAVCCGVLIFGLRKGIELIVGRMVIPLPAAGFVAAALLAAGALAGIALYSLKTECRKDMFESIRSENI